MTIYNIMELYRKLSKFYAESDMNKGTAKHRTMHKAVSADLYKPA